MYLILALIIGVGILVITTKENGFGGSAQSERARMEAHSDEVDRKLQEVQRKYTLSRDKEWKLTHYYFNSERCQEIEERITNEVGITPSQDMIIMGVAAQEGKVLHKHLTLADGIETTMRSRYGSMSPIMIERKFFLWYNDELLKHGFPYELMFAVADPKHGLRVTASCPRSSVRTAPIVHGVYYWEPVINTGMLWGTQHIEVIG